MNDLDAVTAWLRGSLPTCHRYDADSGVGNSFRVYPTGQDSEGWLLCVKPDYLLAISAEMTVLIDYAEPDFLELVRALLRPPEPGR